MKSILFAFFCLIVFGIVSCHDVTVGYLWTEDAGYKQDSMVVVRVESLDATPPKMETVLNPDFLEWLKYYDEEYLISVGIPKYITMEVGAGKDYIRVRFEQPWVSTPIEGVQGTPQIHYRIKSIREESGGDVSSAMKEVKVYGNGTFEVPLRHTMAPGRYVITLNLTNEGYSKDIVDCFTIIVL